MNDVHFYPFQEEAIDKLRSGSILCGGVGTGKSITSLGYFYKYVLYGSVSIEGKAIPPMFKIPLYIITTARKRDTKEWEEECKRFDFKDIPITIDSWNNIGKYEEVSKAFFIFDEQRVVGSGSWVKSFLRITKKNEWILLSATPGDSWSDYIPVFIANGFYKTRTEFLTRHAVYNRYSKYPKIDKWLEVGRLEFLRRRITVLMTAKKQTMQHKIDIPVGYDSELYQRVSRDIWDPFTDTPITSASVECYLMRKVTNMDISRVKAIRSILADHPKVIVFYNFDYELDILKQSFGGEVALAEWNGHKHESIPESDSWLYLVQYTAGCEGWNCTKTDCIIFYSQSYSYKQMIQAAGRIDRLNTPFIDLYYYTLVSSSSIDQAIKKALRNKRNFNENMLINPINFA
jgi:hypothetical protein